MNIEEQDASNDILKKSTTTNNANIKTISAKTMIRGQIYDALREGLVKPISKSSKKTWAEDFINKLLTEAKSNPNGQLGQLIAKQIMQDDILSDLDAQTEKLLMRDQDFLEYRILKQCYKEQQEVLLNDSDKRILVNTSRRTGKTNLAARWLVKKCIKPNSPCLYVHIKFDNAIRQAFDICLECAKQAEVGIDRFSKNEGIIVFKNGSYIKFVGNSNKAEADKIRGFRFRGIVIEEAAFTINPKYLIEDVLTPTMADYKDSQIMMISTPPRQPKTYYEDCYDSGDWKIYEWNAMANPFIPSFRDFINETLIKKGYKESDPFIQREIYGKFAFDTEAQVFKGYQLYNQDPKINGITDVYIGIDFGWNAYNAIVGIASNKHIKKAYVFAERKFNKSTVTDIIRATNEILDQGKKILIDNNAVISNIGIYGDTSDKSIIYEMSQTYGLPAYPCYKYDKANAIAQLAEYCRLGQILNIENGILDDEFQRTLYKRDDQDVILNEIDDSLFHPDAIFALLYASRQLHYDWSDGPTMELYENSVSLSN